jgi:hypothetical protein
MTRYVFFLLHYIHIFFSLYKILLEGNPLKKEGRKKGKIAKKENHLEEDKKQGAALRRF